MAIVTIPKIKSRQPLRYQIKKDSKAWEALCGVWKDKKMGDIVKWQKNIRKEWDRKLPKIK